MNNTTMEQKDISDMIESLNDSISLAKDSLQEAVSVHLNDGVDDVFIKKIIDHYVLNDFFVSLHYHGERKTITITL